MWDLPVCNSFMSWPGANETATTRQQNHAMRTSETTDDYDTAYPWNNVHTGDYQRFLDDGTWLAGSAVGKPLPNTVLDRLHCLAQTASFDRDVEKHVAVEGLQGFLTPSSAVEQQPVTRRPMETLRPSSNIWNDRAIEQMARMWDEHSELHQPKMRQHAYGTPIVGQRPAPEKTVRSHLQASPSLGLRRQHPHDAIGGAHLEHSFGVPSQAAQYDARRPTSNLPLALPRSPEWRAVSPMQDTTTAFPRHFARPGFIDGVPRSRELLPPSVNNPHSPVPSGVSITHSQRNPRIDQMHSIPIAARDEVRRFSNDGSSQLLVTTQAERPSALVSLAGTYINEVPHGVGPAAWATARELSQGDAIPHTPLPDCIMQQLSSWFTNRPVLFNGNGNEVNNNEEEHGDDALEDRPSKMPRIHGQRALHDQGASPPPNNVFPAERSRTHSAGGATQRHHWHSGRGH